MKKLAIGLTAVSAIALLAYATVAQPPAGRILVQERLYPLP